MTYCSLKRDQDVYVSENKRLNTGSCDANSGWGTISLFVVEEIMLYLDLPDILESARVCSHWYSVVQDKTFWKKLLKVHRKLGVDNLELEPDFFYKRLYKMEHAKAVISSTHVPHHEGVQFSNSGEYVSVLYSELVILWRKNEHTGSFEIFNEFMPFNKDIKDYDRYIEYTSFNESDDCILIYYNNYSYDTTNVMVYSMPDMGLLKKVIEFDNNVMWQAIESVCWFDRYTFLVAHYGFDFTLYSVHEEFEPNIIYITNHRYKDYSIDRTLELNVMAVINKDNTREKKIVFYNECKEYGNELYYELHILTVTSEFSEELQVGPNTSTSLTERKSLNPIHYSCSSNITKRIDFQIRQFNGEFPDKIAMVCIPKYSDIDLPHANVEIRLYDFELNLLHILYTHPMDLFIELRPRRRSVNWKVYFYLDQCFILTYAYARNLKIMKYFDMKHEVVLDIVTGNTEEINAAAFSPKNADILCSLTADGVVKFFDFSVY